MRVTAVPGPSRGAHGARPLRAAGGPVLLRGLPAAQGGASARRALAALAAEPRTMVFFEAPHRLAATLAAMAEAFGPDRPAAVCRELTKTYEEVAAAAARRAGRWAAATRAAGEITVVVAGRPRRGPGPGRRRARGVVLERVAAGERLGEAASAVAAASGPHAGRSTTPPCAAAAQPGRLTPLTCRLTCSRLARSSPATSSRRRERRQFERDTRVLGPSRPNWRPSLRHGQHDRPRTGSEHTTAPPAALPLLRPGKPLAAPP